MSNSNRKRPIKLMHMRVRNGVLLMYVGGDWFFVPVLFSKSCWKDYCDELWSSALPTLIVMGTASYVSFSVSSFWTDTPWPPGSTIDPLDRIVGNVGFGYLEVLPMLKVVALVMILGLSLRDAL